METEREQTKKEQEYHVYRATGERLSVGRRIHNGDKVDKSIEEEYEWVGHSARRYADNTARQLPIGSLVEVIIKIPKKIEERA